MNPIDNEQPLYRYSIDGFFVLDKHEGRTVTTAELVDIANRCDEAEQRADRLTEAVDVANNQSDFFGNRNRVLLDEIDRLKAMIGELTSEDKRQLPFE